MSDSRTQDPGGLTTAAPGDAWPYGEARRLRAAAARRASGRRRGIDPTTCERDYTADELEFLRAMQEYKQRCGRPFPTLTEALEVLWGLGYRKPGLASAP
jgi:hypothetical protein